MVYAAGLAEKHVEKVIFERSDSIWMRLVKYKDGQIGIQVCPSKVWINGSPVWQDYTDSAPALVIAEFFTKLMDIDLTAKLEDMQKQLDKAHVDLQNSQASNSQLKNQTKLLVEENSSQRNRLDTLDMEIRRLRRQVGIDPDAARQQGPYR